MFWLAHREYPDDLRSRYFAAGNVLRRFGPYPALKFMEPFGDLCGDDEGQRAEWLAMRAHMHSMLRDFEAADRDIALAFEMAPDRRWLKVEKASILEAEDHYGQALEVIQSCREAHPWFRPAVQSEAHLLELNGQGDEAMRLLKKASEKLECGAVHMHLAGLLRDRQRVEEARAQFEKAATQLPLLDAFAGDAWLSRVRSDIACQLGDYPRGLSLLKDVPKRYKGHFHKRVQAKLEANNCVGEHKQLDIEFVRQHHLTCAPATLTMLAKYWGNVAEHLEVAEDICYDGTPYHAERRWATEQGYTVREFTVTPEATKALIDQGIPFTFSTVEPTSAHLQAVIGYDTARGVLLLRDPFYASVGEILDSALIERYGPFGPRGMVLIPAEHAHRLDSIDLPDAEPWELTHRFRDALVEHRRDDALEVLAKLEAGWADHTLTHSAKLSLADYDGEPSARLKHVKALMERYPKCPATAFRMVHCLNEQGRRSEALALLNTWRLKKESHPVFLEEYARMLASDARHSRRAASMLRRAIRVGSQSAENYSNMADLLWSQRDHSEAAGLYRIAACLEDRRESYAITYFRAQRVLGKEAATLEMLERRLERFGAKSAGPARTLVEAYRTLGRTHDGLGVLDRAMAMRPDDGDLVLYAAGERGSAGQHDEATALLAKAKGKVSKTHWLRTAAFLAQDEGRNDQSLECWKRVIAQMPLDVVAQEEVARLKARLEGPDAGVEHLRDCAERFPHHVGLLRSLYLELQRRDSTEADEVLRRIIATHPADAWAHRELGFRLLERPDGMAGAEAACADAYAIDPLLPEVHGLRGRIARAKGRGEAAAGHFRRAIELDPDYVFAIDQLIDVAPDRASRRASLKFVYDQLDEQAVLGDGIDAYGRVGQRALEADEIEKDLRAMLDKRRGLWQAWAALIDHLLNADKLDSARTLAKQATEQFPLSPPLWNRLAEIERVRLDRPAQIACLERAIKMCPDNRFAVRELAGAYEFDGRAEAAIEMLTQAIARDPHDIPARGRLGVLWWTKGERDKAFEHLLETIRIEPYADEVWNMLRAFGGELKREDEVAASVRAVAAQRPGELEAWMTVAYHLPGNENYEERLAAIDRCLAIAPRHIDAYDVKAQILAATHQHDAAIKACNPDALRGDVPFNLRGRAAWIEADRGEIERAIKMMWELVGENPTYGWGLEMLCEWCGFTGDFRGQGKAANLMVKLDPNNPVSLNFRAHAALVEVDQGRLSVSDRARRLRQAKEDLEHAAQLDPSDKFCGMTLIDLHLADGEVNEAHEAFERIAPFLDDAERLSQDVAINAQPERVEQCRRALTKLCATQSENASLYYNAFARARALGGIVEGVLKNAVTEPDSNPLIAPQLIVEHTDHRQWGKAIRKIDSLRDHTAMWDAAVCHLMNVIAEVPLQTNILARFVRNNAADLAKSDTAWGATGWAMSSHHLLDLIESHFVNWRQREDVEAWMLCNLVDAMLGKGDLAQARELTIEALNMPPDHSYGLHLVELAHCEAVLGDPAQAHDLLDQAAVESLPVTSQFTHFLARGAALARQGASGGPGAQAEAWAHVREAKRRFPQFKMNQGSRKTYRRIVKTIAAQGGMLGQLRGAWVSLFS